MFDPHDRVGLCLHCIHARRVPSRTSVYWRCALAETDARFERYPQLPVIECDGFVRTPERPARGEPGDAGEPGE